MEEALKKRFTVKKIEDLLKDIVNPWPTILCERENPEMIELVRQNVLFAIKYGNFIPFTHEHIRPSIKERLDKATGKTIWGELYIVVNIC